jgi:hypothetical protein
MFRKVIGFFVLFSFLMVNVAALSASSFMEEIAEHSMLKGNEKTEKDTDEEVKVAELDEFLNPPLLLIGDLSTFKGNKYIYNFEPVLNIHISLPYPPPNPLA